MHYLRSDAFQATHVHRTPRGTKLLLPTELLLALSNRVPSKLLRNRASFAMKLLPSASIATHRPPWFSAQVPHGPWVLTSVDSLTARPLNISKTTTIEPSRITCRHLIRYPPPHHLLDLYMVSSLLLPGGIWAHSPLKLRMLQKRETRLAFYAICSVPLFYSIQGCTYSNSHLQRITSES